MMIDPYTWQSLYQQRPQSSSTRKLDAEWFRRARIAPNDERVGRVFWWVRGIDLAVSPRTSADYTAAPLVGLTSDGYLVLRDIYRFRASWTEARRRILGHARADGREVEIAFGVGGQMGGFVDKLQHDDGEFAPYVVHAVQEVGSKLTRCQEWTPLAMAGRVLMVEGEWNEAWLREVAAFTGADDPEDDQIDGFWDAYEVFSKGAPSVIAVEADIGVPDVEKGLDRRDVDGQESLTDSEGRPPDRRPEDSPTGRRTYLV